MIATKHVNRIQAEPIKILLVEDNHIDIKIILRAFHLAQLDCHVYSVEDGHDALEYLWHHGRYKDSVKYPRPDIIVLDVALPRMDGYRFVKEFKTLKDFQSLPIIVYTKKDGMQQLFKTEGVDHYVLKSLDAKKLIARIKHQLKSRYQDSE